MIQRYTVSYELLGSVDEIGADPDGFGLGSDNGSGEGPSTVPSVTIQIFGQSLANDPDPTRVTVPLRNESVVIVGLEEFHVYRFVIFYENSQGRSNSSAPVVAQTFVSGKNKFALIIIKTLILACACTLYCLQFPMDPQLMLALFPSLHLLLISHGDLHFHMKGMDRLLDMTLWFPKLVATDMSIICLARNSPFFLTVHF